MRDDDDNDNDVAATSAARAMEDEEGREPCDVPQAWQRVLQAWNDPAIGAGLEDSALSCGEFEHSVGGHHGEPVMEAAGEEPGQEAATAALGAAAEASAGPGSPSSRRTRSSTETAEVGPRQNLKGWLK